jgi:hypothetical protein
MTAKKAAPGHSHILPSRQTFNTLAQTARDFEASRGAGSRGLPQHLRDAGIVTIRNDSGSDVARYGVLGIGGLLIKPTDNEAEFLNRVLLSGVTPDVDLHQGKFAVLLKPLANGAMGPAVIDGIGQVMVRMLDEIHGYADVADGDDAKLESGATGSAQLLWVQAPGNRTVPNIAWCVARFAARADRRVYIVVAVGAGVVDVRLVNSVGLAVGPTIMVLSAPGAVHSAGDYVLLALTADDEPLAFAGGGESSAVTQFRVKNVRGDYLLVRTWDGNQEGPTTIVMAKDWPLRRTPFDDRGDPGPAPSWHAFWFTYTSAYERRARTTRYPGEGGEEDQIVVPGWGTNDVVYGMPVSPVIPVANVNPAVTVDAAWIQVTDARAWAKRADFLP